MTQTEEPRVERRPTRSAPAHLSSGGHVRANLGSWLAVALIVLGFTLGCFALPTHSVVLWILTGVALVVGGVVALASRIMEQAY